MRISVAITGRAYNAAVKLPRVLDVPDGARIEDALTALRSIAGPLAASALVAVSGEHVGTVADHEPRILTEDAELLFFCPVAGG
jgi:hypothetical protein